MIQAIYNYTKPLVAVNPSTLSGAMDIIVIRQPDGTLRSSCFYIRFGKLQLWSAIDHTVIISINGVEQKQKMYLGRDGNAYFSRKRPEKDFPDIDTTDINIEGNSEEEEEETVSDSEKPNTKQAQTPKTWTESFISFFGSSSSTVMGSDINLSSSINDSTTFHDIDDNESSIEVQNIDSLQIDETNTDNYSPNRVDSELQESHLINEHQDRPKVDVSLCGNIFPDFLYAVKDNTQKTINIQKSGLDSESHSPIHFEQAHDIFETHKIELSHFLSNPWIIYNNDLVFRINGSFFPWEAGLPYLASYLLFNHKIPFDSLAHLIHPDVNLFSPLRGELKKLQKFNTPKTQHHTEQSPTSLHIQTPGENLPEPVSRNEKFTSFDISSTKVDIKSKNIVDNTGIPTKIFTSKLNVNPDPFTPAVSTATQEFLHSTNSNYHYYQGGPFERQLEKKRKKLSASSNSLPNDGVNSHSVDTPPHSTDNSSSSLSNIATNTNSKAGSSLDSSSHIFVSNSLSLPVSVELSQSDTLITSHIGTDTKSTELISPSSSFPSTSGKSLGLPDASYSTDDVGNRPYSSLYNSLQDRFPHLLPTHSELSSFILKPGENNLKFTVYSRLQGTRSVQCKLYLWDHTDKIVISDVDGTITRSDVLGHVLPFLGRDWSHDGIAELYTSIRKHGYKILYLSSRAIGQASWTKKYITSIRQSSSTMPDGPLLLSPTGTWSALKREVYYKTPHQMKIRLLCMIHSLFPDSVTPFSAGFGNRETDIISYVSLNIPSTRIFIINSKGEIFIRQDYGFFDNDLNKGFNSPSTRSHTADNVNISTLGSGIKDPYETPKSISEFEADTDRPSTWKAVTYSQMSDLIEHVFPSLT